MFEKLITNLKNSLSSKKKVQENPDAEEGTESEEQSTDSEPQQEEENSSSSNSNEDAAKKRSMIIKVVVVLALVYLAVDQFILKEEPAPETVTATMPRKKKNKPMPAPTAEASPAVVGTPAPEISPAPAGETVAAPTPAVDTAPVAETNPTIATPPVENVNVVNKENPPAEPTPVPAETVQVPAVEPTPVQSPTPPEAPAEVAPTVNVGEAKQVEKQIDKELDKLIEGENKKDESISAKIVEKVEADAGAADITYVEPPTYDINGRGLVYNCKEKFWVCVDKTSYLQCAKNMKANKASKKPAECATSNVYATNEDCAVIQKHNVSVNAPTDLCNN